MPVGFESLPPIDNKGQYPPWALEFSRFIGSGGSIGAHAVEPSGIGKAKGEGITVAHTDTGYTEHPELIQKGTVRIADARTFTSPAPSYLSFIPKVGGLTEVIEVDVTVNNELQVLAGASIRLSFPNDGVDPLRGMFNGHGTSTASLIMSPDKLPDPNLFPTYRPGAVAAEDGYLPTPITGAAPKAQLLPIRVSDSVLIDPIVANNLTAGILYAVDTAKVDPTLGVLSISMGWPFAGEPWDFQPMARAIEAASDQGIVVCAAAAQTSIDLGFNQRLERLAVRMDAIRAEAEALGDTAADFSDVATMTAVMARCTGLVLSNYSTLAELADDIRQIAQGAGRTLDDIEGFMRLLEGLAERGAATARIIGGPGYPGTDPNTICCAACDIEGLEMPDGLYGREVTITAPGVNMYSAKSARGVNGNDYYTHNSGGTSYSTAITAGACALWQAYHGRENLLNTYGAPFMVHLFHWALKNSADQTTPQMLDASPPIQWDRARRGYGILNAEKLLSPSLELPANTQALIDKMREEDMISDIREISLRNKAAAIGK